MWRFLLMFIERKAESAEVGSLRSEVRRLENQLADYKDVTVPALQRELELEKRITAMQADRIELGTRRVEAELAVVANEIANGGPH